MFFALMKETREARRYVTRETKVYYHFQYSLMKFK